MLRIIEAQASIRFGLTYVKGVAVNISFNLYMKWEIFSPFSSFIIIVDLIERFVINFVLFFFISMQHFRLFCVLHSGQHCIACIIIQCYLIAPVWMCDGSWMFIRRMSAERTCIFNQIDQNTRTSKQ